MTGFQLFAKELNAKIGPFPFYIFYCSGSVENGILLSTSRETELCKLWYSAEHVRDWFSQALGL